MKQKAIDGTEPRTAHTRDDRLRSTRLRLHLPRHLARDELRAWGELITLPGDAPDGLPQATASTVR